MRCRVRCIKQRCTDEYAECWPEFDLPEGAYVVEVGTRGTYRWITYVEPLPRPDDSVEP